MPLCSGTNLNSGIAISAANIDGASSNDVMFQGSTVNIKSGNNEGISSGGNIILTSASASQNTGNIEFFGTFVNIGTKTTSAQGSSISLESGSSINLVGFILILIVDG